ncbi:unnamed protein product [Lampetra fluviatilis]
MSHKSSPSEAEHKGKAVEAVLAGMSASVAVAIEITNLSTYTLENPTYVSPHGVVDYPPHTEIKPGEKRACGFRKHTVGLKGCLGVLRYAIRDTERCLDIFFSSPYACIVYDRTVAVQLENVGKIYVGASNRLLEEIDHSRDKPYDFDKKKAGNSAATVTNSTMNLAVTATMIDDYRSIIRVQLMGL